MPTSRADHLTWCKERALEYVNASDLAGAFSSLVSDLGKHDETQGHMAIDLGAQLFAGGLLSTADEMRKFIEGIG